jgi:hypothetical protein
MRNTSRDLKNPFVNIHFAHSILGATMGKKKKREIAIPSTLDAVCYDFSYFGCWGSERRNFARASLVPRNANEATAIHRASTRHGNRLAARRSHATITPWPALQMR